MFAHSINDSVSHAVTGCSGRVIGLFVDRVQTKSVQVEYVDKNGLVATGWWPQDELSSLTKAPAATAAVPSPAEASPPAQRAPSSKKTAPPASEPESSTPQSNAAASSPPAATPASSQAVAASITVNDLIAAGTKLAKVPATDANDPKTSGKEKLRAIFAEFGADNVTKIKVADYDAVLKKITAATPA